MSQEESNNKGTKEVGIQNSQFSEANRLHEFAFELTSLISKEDLKSKLWLTRSGLFVIECFREKIEEAFSVWFKKIAEINKTIESERIRRHLFGNEYPRSYYIMDGKRPVPGYLICVETRDLRKTGIRHYEGFPLDTKTFIHPKDPILESSPNVKGVSTTKGFQVILTHKNKEIAFSLESLSKFQVAMGDWRQVNEKFPVASESYRDAVLALSWLRPRIRQIPRKYHILVPAAYRDEKKFSYWSLKNIIFIGDERVLFDCYALRGKAYRSLFFNEIELLSKNPRFRQIGDIKLKGNPGPIFAVTEVNSVKINLSIRCLWAFQSAIDFRDPLEKIPPRYTVFDIIRRLSVLLPVSEPVDHSRIGAKTLEKVMTKDPVFRKSGHYLFVLDSHSTIYEIYRKDEWRPTQTSIPKMESKPIMENRKRRRFRRRRQKPVVDR